MNLHDARLQYASKFKPNPLIYWADFLCGTLVAWAALIASIRTPSFSLFYFIATTIAIFATLRAVLFIHELAHLKKGALPFFEFAYNLIFGVPFLAPSLLYTGSHGDHHRQDLFGTRGDPEYAPIVTWSRKRLFFFIIGVLAAPPFLIVRWGILGPVSYFVPPLRKFVVERASSLVINQSYIRHRPKGREHISFVSQELAAAAWIWGMIWLCLQGIASWHWIAQWSVVAAGTLFINQIRTLAAHRYTNDGHKFTVEEQLHDSINLDGGSILTALAAPIGLRFHALHHFLPNVPYHALPSLHRKLIHELGEDSPYLQSSRPGIIQVVGRLFTKSQT